MKTKLWSAFAGMLAMLAWSLSGSADDPIPVGTPWNLTADIVEASTDAKLCPCYDPMGKDRERHRCRFIMMMRIQEGAFGEVKLDGMKVALAGDLGRDLSGPSITTLVIVTEPGATKEQKEALDKLVREIYPLRWTRKVSASGILAFSSDSSGANGAMGQMGRISLTTVLDENGVPVVKRGLAWWNAQSNSGFTLATGTLSFKGAGEDFSQESCSGFSTHIEAKGVASGAP